MAIKHSIAAVGVGALVHLISGAAMAAEAGSGPDPITATNNEFAYGAGWRQTAGGAKAGLNLELSRQLGPLYHSASLTYSAGHTLDADVRLGAVSNAAGQIQITPYVGYGFRRWTDASYQSLGLGMLLQHTAGQRLVIGADVGLSYAFDGLARSASFGTARLPAAPAGRLGVSADYALTRLTHVKISYRAERLWAGQPAGQAGSWRSTTQTAMVSLAVAY